MQENSFFVGGERFLIRERKKQKGKKTQYYLIKLPFQYVSSLFPTGEQESYTFDYEQKLYKLERNEHSVTLKFL